MRSAANGAAHEYPAVTLSVAKLKGTNATIIANEVLQRVHDMRGVTLPNDVHVTTTRNYGKTAKEKADTLLEHLFIATITVTILIALFLGWRESGVVLLAIPVTLALTLAIFYLLGYTLNRVTLFALTPEVVKEVVYTMRFDKASALYGEFGRFYVGYVTDIADALGR